MRRLKAFWLLSTSRAFFVQTEHGFASFVPSDINICDQLLPAAENVLDWLRNQEQHLL